MGLYLDTIFEIDATGVTLSRRIEVRQRHCDSFSSPNIQLGHRCLAFSLVAPTSEDNSSPIHLNWAVALPWTSSALDKWKSLLTLFLLCLGQVYRTALELLLCIAVGEQQQLPLLPLCQLDHLTCVWWIFSAQKEEVFWGQGWIAALERGAGDDTGVLAPWMDCVPGPTLPKHTFRPVCAWREFEPKLIAKGCVDKLAFSIEMFSSTGNHPVSDQINCTIHHPAVILRSSKIRKFALEVGGPEFHWTFAAFSRSFETSHNQNTWRTWRKYRIWSNSTAHRCCHGQCLATELRQWEVRGEVFASCSEWICKGLYGKIAGCTLVQITCQTESSNKFVFRSKLQDNAEKPWFWGPSPDWPFGAQNWAVLHHGVGHLNASLLKAVVCSLSALMCTHHNNPSTLRKAC